jgi:lysozyme family protein
MAKIEGIIPHIIKWEAGVIGHAGEEPSVLFERARKKGFANDPDDKGGATQTGVTLATYKDYCKKNGISEPTVDNLKNIPYTTWRDILKSMYWDRWGADKINSQAVANMLVDWVWASGKHGIRKPQELLGVKVDGIVGNKTLAAVNGRGEIGLIYQLRDARIAHFENIVKANPSQKKFLNGWKNRVMDLKFV